LKRARQLRLICRISSLLSLRLGIFYPPLIDCASVEKVFDDLGIEDVEGDLPRSTGEPDGSRAGARKTPVR